MKPRLLPAAVACALAAPAALAQTSNVQIYGRANLGIDNFRAEGSNGANFDSRMRVFDNSSRVGLRGSEDLGSGLRAIFQIETGVNIDNGSNTGQAGANNGSTGFWASRDSYVGLDSQFGRLLFGRRDIFRSNGTLEQAGGTYFNTSIPMNHGAQTLGLVTSPGGRQSNVVEYTTPDLAGFNASVYYSPQAEAAQAGGNTDAQMWAVTGRYRIGPFGFQADYAIREDIAQSTGGGLTAPTSTAEVSGWKVSAGWYYMPGALISLIYVDSKNENVAGNAPGVTTPILAGGGFWNAGDNLKQRAWMVNWEHTFGNIQVVAQYGQSGDVKGGNLGDSSARAWLVGGRYLLSKRTWVYASYTQIRNDENSYADYNVGQITSALPVGANQGGGSGFSSGSGLGAGSSGADPRVIAVGLVHNF
jgi:predicted porin